MKKLVALLIVSVAFATAPVFSDSLGFAVSLGKGITAYQEGDYKTARNKFLTLANELEDEGAQYMLGIMHYEGKGYLQDYGKALTWFKLSAEQGYSSAQIKLGIIYYEGKIVDQDYKEAIKWWKLSAEQGKANAQTLLAIMYSLGEGVTQDIVRAHMWANIAASNGDENAPEERDAIAEEMTSVQLEEAQDLAHRCIKKKYKGC